ncbi:nitrite reductase small subunit NirD [Sulfitobacter pseudonitzschiae]|uniref:Nitrite reductase small subunit NirD n=1 Tax=Pseudosulfitobacter pseudonitzschiae TaxID=1402135 RepID=A0A9Q2RTM6_9RHOB|nr:nitrite reductase small subunit NirD [Pseudosulfitobacter pseudonitzschiae]MBM2293718.1 nitrite reductase small subunit NirD [Pseudosulfitobacter pseudonitzschiae]MBM2298532.1 nitrite reductase small subunit NirD [Pseudosulfitobacter pseudonitzschiae]MBM2303446.1 nitrite reductase small subunit NirD [Pseudosulfitobacter pseudonitzschiae]MBM2313229.1 nitrite reductase small subunit NirD [Pseudosulfitobacter pseudonitzschiae]MBM2318142.1 nitrite reductase small subunit NirD [Pseudosulfitobact
MTDWTDIGALTDIPERGARVVKTHLGCVAVFRTINDEVFAIDDACPHKGGPLSEGIVHGRSVTCPLHNMVLRLDTGLAQSADEGAVSTYAVRVEKGRIMLDTTRLRREQVA